MTLADLRDRFEIFLSSDDTHLWLIDPQVMLDGDWEAFHECFRECRADLLATQVRTRGEDPDWFWWSRLQIPSGERPADGDMVSLLALARVSRAAAGTFLTEVERGWNGHPEALLPTVVSRSGLVVEDIGGTGRFVPEGRRGLWYDHRTWHWQRTPEHVSGMLHFPAPSRSPRQPLSPYRFQRNPGRDFRILYASPVGREAEKLLPEILKIFGESGADCRLLQYDDYPLPVPGHVTVVQDPGYKWQLALRHLAPETVAEYDYIFFWDDDIRAGGFDPIRFARLMKANRLDMAQPAIHSDHWLAHDITWPRHPPLPMPQGNGDVRHIVGRLTNFVEIMVPVFSREGWREFYSYLQPDNKSGWGYDYIPMSRKGIVDAMPVEHTRPVRSDSPEAKMELGQFLESQGLHRHGAVTHGWLFE